MLLLKLFRNYFFVFEIQSVNQATLLQSLLQSSWFAVFIGSVVCDWLSSYFAPPSVFAHNAFCLIIYLFPESTSVYTKYKVLMLHHGVTENFPSGCRQQYFSSGRHLAAAARVTLASTPAGMGHFRNPFRQRAGPTPDADARRNC